MTSSALKTGSYCLMHLLVAIAVAYALTGDLRAAMAVGVVEPLVQTIAFVLHDRFWAKREGRTAVRHRPGACTHGGLTLASLRPALSTPVLKTGSYAVMHMIVAVTVAYALTGSWRAALAIGTIEPLVQTVAFLLHDRVWKRVGQREVASPDASRALGGVR